MKLPTKPLPRTPLIAPVTYHSGTLRSRRFPLFPHRFLTFGYAKAWRPRGGPVAPLGATGFNGKVFLPDLLVYHCVHDFGLIMTGLGTPLIESLT